MILTHRPVPHGISQGFGVGPTRGKPHPVYGDYQPVGHLATDFGCPVGTPIVAAATGTVVFAGWGQNMPKSIAEKYGYIFGPDGWASGLITIIDHGDGSATAYSHQSELRAAVGQRVAGGQVIGLSGMTGRSTGPHLHFEYMTLPINYGSPYYSRLDPMAQYGSDIQTVGTVTQTEGFLMALSDKKQEDIYWILCTEDGRKFLAELVSKPVVDTAFSKRDGSYQNRILEQDFAPAIGRIEASLGTKLDKADGHSLRLAIQANSGGGDAQTIAKAVIDAVGKDLAKDVVKELGAALTKESK